MNDTRSAIMDRTSPGDGTTESILDVDGLRVEFRTAKSIARALRGVSFSVSRGETLVIVGESGSGKSVTAETILGILASPPGHVAGGSIRFAGRELLSMPPAERREIQGDRIAMVFQDALAALNPVFSIGWQIAELFRVHRGLSMREGTRRAVELLRRVEIPNPEERARQFAHQLSGGMRQRVMIAMAIALEPDVLLADEPTTALDVTVQAQIMQLLARLRRETGMALVLITHDIAMASEVGDRIAVMYGGRIVETGAMADILARPAHPYTLALVTLAREEQTGERRPIKGSPIDLTRIPPGCSFRARCSFAIQRCAAEDPLLRTVGRNSVACHRAEDVLQTMQGAAHG